MIVGISGKIGTGKTTLAEMIEERLEADGITAACISFGSLLKEEASERFGFPLALCYSEEGKGTVIFHPDLPSQSMTVREILQWWGTDVRRAEDPDYWVKAMEITVPQLDAEVKLIDDVRFPNEADWVQHVRKGGLVRLFPYRGWVPGPYACHDSETALDRYSFPLELSPDYNKLAHEAENLATNIKSLIIEMRCGA